MTGIPSPLVGTFAQNTSAATTLNCPYPASLTSSHIMVLGVADNNATPATLPVGWTQVFRASGTGSTVAPGLLVAIKQATGSETGNLAVTTPSVKSSGQIIAFTGVNLTTPQDVAAGSIDDTTSHATVPIPGVTTTRTGDALVYIATHNGGSDTSVPPTSPGTFTETGDNPGAGGWAFGMGYLVWSGSGATGTVNVTFNAAAKGLGVLVALRALDLTGVVNVGETATISTAATAEHITDLTVAETATVTTAATATHLADATVAETATVATDSAVSRSGVSNVGVTAARSTDSTVTRPAASAVAETWAASTIAAATHAADLAVAETATVTTAATATHPAAVALTTTVTIATDAAVTGGGTFKVYTGGAWTAKPLKVYVGGSWVHKPIKTWDGATWS